MLVDLGAGVAVSKLAGLGYAERFIVPGGVELHWGHCRFDEFGRSAHVLRFAAVAFDIQQAGWVIFVVVVVVQSNRRSRGTVNNIFVLYQLTFDVFQCKFFVFHIKDHLIVLKQNAPSIRFEAKRRHLENFKRNRLKIRLTNLSALFQ